MDANGRKLGLKRAESGRETTKCAKNAKFLGGKGKNEAQRGWAAGTRFQIGGVGRGCIPAGFEPAARPGAAYNRSGDPKIGQTEILAGKQEICMKTGGDGRIDPVFLCVSCFPA